MSQTEPITPPPPRRRGQLLVLGVILLSIGGWAGWKWFSRIAVPEIALTQADPAVVEAVQAAREEILANPRSAKVWGNLGMVLIANKLATDAVPFFTRASELDPADPRWPYLLGIALIGYDPDQALPHLRRAVTLCRQPGQRAVAHLRLAETLAANGYAEEAETHFRAVDDPDLAPSVDYGLGVLAIIRGDLQMGKQHLTRCIDSPTTRQRATGQLLSLSRQLGEPFNAPANLPTDAPWTDWFLDECMQRAAGKASRMNRITTLEQQGQLDRALELLRRLAIDYPDAPTLLALGISLGRVGKFTESEEVMRRCLELEPELVRAQYYLSLALFAQGEALQKQGRKMQADARFEEAAKWARQSIERMPHHGESHFQLGLSLWCLDRRAEAITAFRQAVTTSPQLGDAHFWLGRALAETGQRREAEQHFRDAIRYGAPDDPRPRQALDQIIGKSP